MKDNKPSRLEIPSGSCHNLSLLCIPITPESLLSSDGTETKALHFEYSSSETLRFFPFNQWLSWASSMSVFHLLLQAVGEEDEILTAFNGERTKRIIERKDVQASLA